MITGKEVKPAVETADKKVVEAVVEPMYTTNDYLPPEAQAALEKQKFELLMGCITEHEAALARATADHARSREDLADRSREIAAEESESSSKDQALESEMHWLEQATEMAASKDVTLAFVVTTQQRASAFIFETVAYVCSAKTDEFRKQERQKLAEGCTEPQELIGKAIRIV